MKTQTTEQRAETNRRNALKSTGPKTEAGREKSRMNAVKHGIFSREVVVRGGNCPESSEEFAELHARFVEDLQPEGVVEELLVDQVVRAHWRLRRALAAEAGEVAQSLERAQRGRGQRSLGLMSKGWGLSGNPERAMRACTEGNVLLGTKLLDLLLSVQATGELTAAAVQAVNVAGQPLELTRELEALRVRLQENPQGLEGAAWRRWRKQEALARIDHELAVVKEGHDACQRREEQEDAARLAAARLPAEAVLEKIVRYERMLERQIERGLGQLEKRRKGRTTDRRPQTADREPPKGDGRAAGGDRGEEGDGTEGTNGELRNEASLRAGREVRIGDVRFQRGDARRPSTDGQSPVSETPLTPALSPPPRKGEGGELRNEASLRAGREVRIGDVRFQRGDASEETTDGSSPMSEPPLTPALSPPPRKGEGGELRNEANAGNEKEGGFQIGDFKFQTAEAGLKVQGQEGEGERPQRFGKDKDGEHAGSETGAPAAEEGERVGGILRNEANGGEIQSPRSGGNRTNGTNGTDAGLRNEANGAGVTGGGRSA